MEPSPRSHDELAEKTHHIPEGRKVRYSQDIEYAISGLQAFLQKGVSGTIPYNDRWTAIKLIEDDKIVRDKVLALAGDSRQAVEDEIRIARQ